MPTHLKKITLAVLSLAGLLFTPPLTFAHKGWEQGRNYIEFNRKHQERSQDLNSARRAFYSQHYFLREQRRLEREHQTRHENLKPQHEDYHDGNRYRDLVEDSLSESPAISD